MAKKYVMKVIALVTVDFIIKDKIYVMTEVESIGSYLIDETGEENYYSNSEIKYMGCFPVDE